MKSHLLRFPAVDGESRAAGLGVRGGKGDPGGIVPGDGCNDAIAGSGTLGGGKGVT